MSCPRHWVPWLLVLTLTGCGGAQAGTGSGEGDHLAPQSLYPLAEGNVWSYNVRVPGEALPTLHVQRVTSVRGSQVEVRSWSDRKERYELREEGVYRPRHEGWLLRAPVRVGAGWPSSASRTARVTSVRERVEVPAGVFDGCVRVEETANRARVSTDTVYCPGVGPVYVESSLRADTAGKAIHTVGELLGYDLVNDR